MNTLQSRCSDSDLMNRCPFIGRSFHIHVVLFMTSMFACRLVLRIDFLTAKLVVFVSWHQSFGCPEFVHQNISVRVLIR